MDETRVDINLLIGFSGWYMGRVGAVRSLRSLYRMTMQYKPSMTALAELMKTEDRFAVEKNPSSFIGLLAYNNASQRYSCLQEVCVAVRYYGYPVMINMRLIW